MVATGSNDPPKRRKTFHRELCVVCQTTTDVRVHQASAAGIRTFSEAARIRKDDVYDRVEIDLFSNPVSTTTQLFWHPICYRSYTSNNNMRGIDGQKESKSECHSNTDDALMQTRSNTPNVDWNMCIICQRKSHKKNYTTCTIETDDRCEQLHAIAARKKDEQLLMRIDNVNLVTKRAQYHTACFCKYMYISRTCTSSDSYGGSIDKERVNVYDEAFRTVAESMVDTTIANKTACEMTDLTKAFREELRVKGVESNTYKTCKLKRRIQDHYQDRISFAKPSQRNKSELVYGSNTEGDVIQVALDQSTHTDTIGMYALGQTFNDEMEHAVLRPVASTSNTTHLDTPGVINGSGDTKTNATPGSSDATSNTITIYHAAQIIRNDIDASKGINIQPLDPVDLTIERTESIIPASLKDLLTSIICTDEDVVLDVDKRRILSIAQDIMNASSHARVKTPKHIGLGITVKHMTGSKEVVTILNRMGHCSSYQDIQGADTSLAKEVIAKTGDSGVVVPSNIVPGRFVQAAADNIDFTERTVDGLQTTHATSVVLYQERGKLTENKKISSCVHSNRERSLGKRTMKDDTITYTAAAKRPIVTDFVHKKDTTWYDTGSESSNLIDREWTLLRMVSPTLSLDTITLLNLVTIDNQSPHIQTIPGWSGFNSLLSAGVRVEDTTTVGYCPLINAPPTDNETVYNVLKNLNRMMTHIGQQHSVITFDMAIYSRAKEIQWRRPDEFRNTVIRLGGFHIALNYLAVIGKMFSDGGLCDVLTESSMYGPNTADQLLVGRSYNRGVRAHKLMYESLMRLLWREFLQYIQNDGLDINEEDVCTYLGDWRDCVTGAADGIALHFPDSTNTMDNTHRLFREFVAKGINASQTFKFWMIYLGMVEILLAYIRAERSGKWKDHLDAVCRMIPYFMALDRHNYGRWLPVYVAEMRMLPDTCPAVHEELTRGHAVARTTHKFARVWTDQALEQTLNKDTKKKGGGLIGITKKDEAVDRWCLAYHDRALIVQATKTMFGIDAATNKHQDLSKATINRDEHSVREVVNVFKSGLALNPFETSLETDEQSDNGNQLPLSNIITGTTLPQNVSKRLLSVKEIGEEKLKEFVDNRLDTNQVLFWEPLKNAKILTFSTIKQATVTRPSQEKKVPISDRNLLGRLLILSSHRKIQKEEVLSHELTTVPMALAHADGSLRKSNKCELLAELEKKTDSVSSIPEPTDMHTTAVIVDAMALVQTIKTTGMINFGDFSDRCTSCILGNFALNQCVRVDVVFDRYDIAKSIKAAERSRRGKHRSSLDVKIQGRLTPLPKRWTDFLSNSTNKVNLIEFLTEQWQQNLGSKLDNENEVRIAGGLSNHEVCLKVTSHDVMENPELCSNHEEADTRLLLHAQDASRDHKQVVITSPDTDVAILCIHFRPQLQCELLWFYTGIRDRRRYIPIHALANAIGADVCRALPALHALSGCDSTSSIRSITKKKALSSIDKAGVDKIVQLGDDIPISEETRSKCEEFVCNMYQSGKGIHYSTCDALRYDTFLHKTQNSENLPPTSDSITQHILRSNYQTFIWKQSLLAHMNMKDPDGNGWMMDGGMLCPKLMVKDPAPRGMVELTVCHCVKSQCQTRCSCKTNGLHCTDACKCSAGNYCKNPTKLTNDTDDESDDDGEEI